MTTETMTQTIPVRLDFDAAASGFSKAMGTLDRAATRALDDAGHRRVLAVLRYLGAGS